MLVNIAKAHNQQGNKREMTAFTLKACSMVGQGMVLDEKIKREVEKLNEIIRPSQKEKKVKFRDSGTPTTEFNNSLLKTSSYFGGKNSNFYLA